MQQQLVIPAQAGPTDREVSPGPTGPVAAHLQPTKSFDTCSEMVIEYLSAVAPMGLWMVTRVHSGRQIVLSAKSPGYDDVGVGDDFPYSVSFCRSMVSGAAPRIAPDVSQVPEYAESAALASIPVSSYVGTPIVQPNGELFGALCAVDADRQPADLTEHQPLLDLLSALLSAVLESDLATTSIARELEQARLDADSDALTGLVNRRGWDRYLELEEQRYRRFGDPACVIVFDLDHLKIVNDTQGHEAGDRHLQQTARVLASKVRRSDVLARLGGDEFGIVMPGATPEQADELIARLRGALREAGISGCFGHAAYTVAAGFPGAWDAADQAMYEQKRLRRKRS